MLRAYTRMTIVPLYRRTPLACHARSMWKPAGLAPPPPSNDRELAIKFVKERGYEHAIANAVVVTLSGEGWASEAASAGGLFALAKRLAGRWEMGADEGLHNLAKSIEFELAAKAGKKNVTFLVMPPRGEPFTCEALEGMSLKEVAEHGETDGARQLAELLECACAGVMACSTCHVYVDTDWAAAVGPPSEAEEDMLDLAFERRGESRLGCQIRLNPALDGLRVSIPGGAHNLFDYIPFEDNNNKT